MECSICYMDLLDDPKYTECNHVYCINCICKIKKCSMCRRELNHVNICREIIKKNLPTPINTLSLYPLSTGRASGTDNITYFEPNIAVVNSDVRALLWFNMRRNVVSFGHFVG